jgi:hypothetical protein
MSPPRQSDRLAELLRQRAALQEHLAWLDREIASAADSSPPSVSRPIAPPVPPAAPTSAATAPAATGLTSIPSGNAEAILEHYRAPPDSLQRDVRQGCFLYFTLALVLLALAVMALYFAIGSR